jgi:hypothetical protein
MASGEACHLRDDSRELEHENPEQPLGKSGVGETHMPGIIQCPYCVEGDDFKVMAVKADGHWLRCDRCSHTIMPDYPTFQCECQKCKEQNSK